MFNLCGQEEAIRTKDGDLTHFQPVICTTNSDSDGHPGAGNAITQLQLGERVDVLVDSAGQDTAWETDGYLLYKNPSAQTASCFLANQKREISDIPFTHLR